jgi:hypothetical protein
MTEAIRDGLRLEAIAADIAGDGDAALDLLGTTPMTSPRWTATFPGLAATRSPSGSSRPGAARGS